MRPTAIFAFIVIAAVTIPAFAQAPPAGTPTRIRGTVDNLADHTLTVKARDGSSVVVTLAPNFSVRSVVTKTLADIKPGEKIGITSVKGSDGTRRAVEIHIFPASMTTVRMGEFPWDLGAGSLMTNAPVAEVRGAAENQTIKVTVNGAKEEINVPSGIPIVAFAAGEPGLLKPGAAVIVFAQKSPDGKLTAAAVAAEKDGVKPPM
jgi:hypothetical protein